MTPRNEPSRSGRNDARTTAATGRRGHGLGPDLGPRRVARGGTAEEGRIGTTRIGTTRIGRARRVGFTGVLVVMLAALVAGCGIRTTSVPVDAGPAPSRMPCRVAGESVITQSRPGVPMRIYLACASGLASVERAAPIPQGKSVDSRMAIAQGLLDELQAQPSTSERDAGFTTYVRGPLILSAPRKGDPAGTLRLSRQPEDLPATALAQIVCTFAESEISEITDGTVFLGGPGDYPPRGYGCDPKTKTNPDTAVPTLAPRPSASASASTSVSASVSGSASEPASASAP
ncbi:hypothetical protein [Streptomyces sp. NPDC059479]|uniref:hypothetical protein n=1 Tax=Streptomyces sp. NPDC059479 TaxID=3346848 RepID=UPI00369DE284